MTGVLGGPAIGFTLDGEWGWLPDPDWFEPPEETSRYWDLASKLWNTMRLAVDTDEGGVLGGLETGGGVDWGEWPLMTLPFPLVLLFCSTLAEATAKEGPLSFGLDVEVEEGGL